MQIVIQRAHFAGNEMLVYQSVVPRKRTAGTWKSYPERKIEKHVTTHQFFGNPAVSFRGGVSKYSLENQHVPWKSMVGRCIFYWNSPFLGDMLVFLGDMLVLRGVCHPPEFSEQNGPLHLHLRFALWMDRKSSLRSLWTLTTHPGKPAKRENIGWNSSRKSTASSSFPGFFGRKKSRDPPFPP